MRLFCQ